MEFHGDIVDLYISRICIQSHHGEKPVTLVDTRDNLNNHSNISTREIEFDSIIILDSSKNIITHAYSDDEIIISFSFLTLRDVEDPVFGILIPKPVWNINFWNKYLSFTPKN